MDEDEPTSVIRMLNNFRRSTENRNSGVSLRLSGSGITPSVPMSIYKDKRSSTSSSFRGNIASSSSIVNDSVNLSTSPRELDESTPTKRLKLDTKSTSCLSLASLDAVPNSPWEWRRLKGENLSLRTRLSHQEATVQQLHKIRREMDEVFSKEKNMLENQAELDKSTIEQLELRLDAARRSTQEAREALSSSENEFFQMKAKMEQQIMELENENARLIEENRHAKELEDSMSSKAEDDNDNDELEEARLKLEAAEDRISELEQKLRERLGSEQEFELLNVELQNARLQIEHLESEKSVWEEGKALTAKAARANDLEKELNHAKEMISTMRESIKGKLLLEEQMTTLKQRIEHIEEIEQQVAILKVQQSELKAKLVEYEAIGIGNCPAALKREINRLQQAEAILTCDEGQLRSKADAMQRENQLLQKQYDEAKKIATEMTTSNERWNKLVSRLQKKMMLVTRERDSYRQQLDLYEKEMSTNDVNSAIIERIPELEKNLDGYRELVKKLESDLAAVSDPEEIIGSSEECKRLRDEVIKLKGELEHRALKGDFNSNARILHFKMNPAEIASQQAEDKQKALLKEVEELRAMIQLGNSGVSVAGSSLHAQEIADLKQTHEIKIARLKDAFKVSSQEYRQACYQLFGWRVDRTKEGRYKLSSQYAESSDDFLFFHVGEGVDLLETSFSATLGHLIDRHLQMQHSVPMFLNAVQAELFSQQTVTISCIN